MYYTRQSAKYIRNLLKGFPVIVVTGPRQSGKTTFLRHNFKDYHYVNLENPADRELIASDPQDFLARYSGRVIMDEAQRLPEFFSYLQMHVDERQEMGSFILSGSQNLLISEKVSQSLAGRAAYHTLLPFSLSELKRHRLAKQDRFEQIWQGFYPAIYSRNVEPGIYYGQYISTYVERDARLTRNIQDLSQFQKFISLLAGRVGQIVNLSSLAGDAGISPHTAEDWISLLEASYIVFRLQPYYRNTGKRLIKSPKIYFYDTGLLAALLKIASPLHLTSHYAVGHIFENFVITEYRKELLTSLQPASLYFYRDSHGNEVDLVIDTGAKRIPVEIKSSATYSGSFFRTFTYWRNYVDGNAAGHVVYGGTQSRRIGKDKLVGWKNLHSIL